MRLCGVFDYLLIDLSSVHFSVVFKHKINMDYGLIRKSFKLL